MIRYYFNITINGIRVKVHVNANNQMAARNKIKRLYPMAENINLIRSNGIWKPTI